MSDYRLPGMKSPIVIGLIWLSIVGLSSSHSIPRLTPEDETIPFGLVAAENGDLQPWGEESVKGAQLAIDEFNAAGGIKGKKVRLYVEDSNSKPEVGRIAAKSLVSEHKVILLLGDVASSITAQMGEIAKQKDIPLISVGSTRPSLNDGNPYLFRVCYTDAFEGPVMAKFAYEVLKLRRVALVTDRKQHYSIRLSNGFRAYFRKRGGKIVDEEFYDSGQVDFHEQISRLRWRKLDGLFLSGYFNETGPFVRQASETGLSVKMMGGSGWESKEILLSGGPAILGSYFCNHYNRSERRPEVATFLAKWARKYDGNLPKTSIGALAYDAARLACEALKRARSVNASGLRSAIDNTVGFKGVTGTITLKGRHGNPPKRAIVAKITKDGQEFVRVYEPDKATRLPR